MELKRQQNFKKVINKETQCGRFYKYFLIFLVVQAQFLIYIEITGTLDRLAAGETIDEIVAGYRGRVSRSAIIEAIQLVSDRFIKTLPEFKTKANRIGKVIRIAEETIFYYTHQDRQVRKLDLKSTFKR